MTLEARFASYYPTPTYFVSTNFDIKVINTCIKSVITPNTNTTLYYVVNSGP
jgi:hypothetical protein